MTFTMYIRLFLLLTHFSLSFSRGQGKFLLVHEWWEQELERNDECQGEFNKITLMSSYTYVMTRTSSIIYGRCVSTRGVKHSMVFISRKG